MGLENIRIGYAAHTCKNGYDRVLQGTILLPVQESLKMRLSEGPKYVSIQPQVPMPSCGTFFSQDCILRCVL